jgi:hypothetical protein
MLPVKLKLGQCKKRKNSYYSVKKTVKKYKVRGLGAGQDTRHKVQGQGRSKRQGTRKIQGARYKKEQG